ncbi:MULTISPECIES: hypothetical protein [Mesorhizobium]|uniref:hypothetical protein n=1 Tax=Mesorhizobium TaxID=68287 RepID=UPI0007A95289|nr:MULTISPECIES: hypothetical protein [Mesorhizobium]AMX93626.1 hypothetical protein A4R28_11215 [Mesorhizobium ciceri]MDF3208317.1 hypothetical protein [Mesorhizobium sp. LMG15046]MDF3229111.1 hypothetical protein [Mesorhizobium sp. DSM 30133]RUU22220.1 hypothetical protein EOC84_03675 [Mesorhizobium sp. Primo-B]RUU37870.1 hypothetical protein EOC83_16540 [Mesorhizobium sp. Primo-A]
MLAGSGLSLAQVAANIGAGGGGGATVGAVHFDGSTQNLIAESLAGVVDSYVGSFSVWLNPDDWHQNRAIFIPDTTNFNTEWFGGSGSGPPDFLPSGVGNEMASFVGGLFRLNADGVPGSIVNGAWQWVAGMFDANHLEGEKIIKLFINGIDKTGSVQDFGDQFMPGFGGLSFALPDILENATFYSGGMAEFWWAPGQFVDFSDSEVRAKFMSAGKPVDLGADGSTPTGTAPAVFLSGDAATFGTNKGTGGVLTPTGTLTNASTSPSD